MIDILQHIASYKLREVEHSKSLIGIDELKAKISDMAPPRQFKARLMAASANGDHALITEIKKASPSKGVIRDDFVPVRLARQYRDGGGACISVLTDAPSFQGSLQYLHAVRQAVDLPLLCKDFMLDVYQVIEARAFGADCILLILAMIDDDTAKTLIDQALELNIDILLEVHDEHEMERALKLNRPLVGINNRNLKTFKVSLATSRRLAEMATDDKILISESGISSYDDIVNLSKYGFKAFLVGETLMRQHDVRVATRNLLGHD